MNRISNWRRWMRATLAAGMAAGLVACGGSDDAAPAPPPPPPAPAIGSATIGAAGGVVDGPDGTQLVIPPGALSSDVLIRIARSRTGAPDLPAAASPSLPVYEVTPHGLLFAQPVQLKIPANPQGGTSESAWAAEPGGPWSTVAARGENGLLVVDRISLSWFTYPVPGNGEAFVQAADIARPFQADPAGALRYERVIQEGPPAVVFNRMVLSENATLRLPLKFTALPGCTDGELEVESQFQPHLSPTLPRQTVLRQAIVLVAPALASREALQGLWVAQHTFQTAVSSSSRGRQYYFFKYSCRYGSPVRTYSTGFTEPIYVEPAGTVAPAFTVSPVTTQVVAGQPASFTAIAQGTPAPSISWQVAPATGAFTDVVGEPACAPTAAPASGVQTNASCRLAITPLGNNGQRYRAIASNVAAPGGVASSEAVLTITAAPVAPSITQQPQAQTTTVGGSATFSVTATGTATLGYTWRLNGTPLPAMTGGFGTTTTCSGTVTYSNGNATITLSGLSAVCNGALVDVTVSNGVNPSAVSNNVTLTVNPATQSLSLLAGAIGGGGTLDGTGTLARGRFSRGSGIAFDDTGTAYFSDQSTNRIRKVTEAGVVTTMSSVNTLLRPAGVAVDAARNLYVAEADADRITRITPAGVASVWAGGIQGDQDGNGTQARFANPEGLAIDATGNLYVAETPSYRNGKIRKISPTGVVTTFYDFGAPYGKAALAVDAAGTVYAAGGTVVQRIPPNTPAGTAPVLAGDPTQPGNLDGQGTAARFNFISGIALAADGNLYVTASNNFNVRRITPAGLVTTVSGGGPVGDGAGTAAGYEFPSSIAAAPGGGYLLVGDVTTMRKLTLSNAFASTFLGSRAQRGINDGSGAAARFNSGGDVVLDSAGNTYVAGGDRIRKIQPDGLVTTVAVTPANYLAIDLTSGVLVASNQFEVWRVTTAGVVSRLAGDSQVQDYVDGQGANAAFSQIAGLAVDRAGNVFVAEGLSHTIRRISPAGVVTTIAGARDQSGTSDGAAALARFNSPAGMAVDANDNLFVGDSGNRTIRKVTPQGVVSTPAGTPGVSGSADGNGAAASFRGTGALAFDRNGRLLIADGCALRRMEPVNFAVSTVLGVDGQCGVVLGNSPRINGASGIAVRSDGRLVLMSDFAVLEAVAP